jgi:hypothetical protein
MASRSRRLLQQPVIQQTPSTPAVEPLVINSGTLAALLQTSKTTVFRRLALGELLRPHTQWGQQPRWLLAEVREWIAAGCPSQAEWEARKRTPAG